MSIPNQTTSIVDGAIGFGGSTGLGTIACVGVSSSGSASTVYSFTDSSAIVSSLGYGPLSEMIAYTLGGTKGTVLAVKVVSDVAGANGAVTASGTSPPTLTLSGTPLDTFNGVVKIVTGGTRGTATFKYSVDGGDTYSATLATAATYAIPHTGITLEFASGTYVSDNVYTWLSTEPGLTTSALNTALDTLFADPRLYEIVQVVGVPQGNDNAAKATASAAIAAALQAKLDTLATNNRWAVGVTECGLVTDDASGDSALSSAFANTVAAAVSSCADFCEIISPISGRQYTRSIAWAYVDLMRRRTYPTPPHQYEGGTLRVVSIRRNEEARTGLDDARLVTARTIAGSIGYFITRPKLLHATSSDYDEMQFRRIINRACSINRVAMMRFLNKPTPVNDDGTIDTKYADQMEAEINAKLAVMVGEGACSWAKTEIIRTDNITLTRQIRNMVRVKRFEPAETLTSEIGFNPIAIK